jgi:RNA polymerase sigma-70 factor (ECF subfamily)
MKIKAWLYRTARNLCYDQLRRSNRESVELENPESRENPYGFIDLLAHLSQRERDIVTLKVIGGLTHREIGVVLGITAAAAQKRYERAIATLREEEDAYGTKTT